jgi:hypothetical protein
MRVGYFTVAGENSQRAEVTIIPLPGLAGSDLDNVNRWLNQLGAPPWPAEDLARKAEPLEVDGKPAQLFDLAGPEGAARKRMLAAILRREGTAWFFKMTGDDALVAAQKAVYLDFLKGLQFEATSSPDTALQSSPPPVPPQAGTPPTAGTPPVPTSPAVAAEGLPTFVVPARWKAQSPGPMQAAKYVPDGAEGKVEVTLAVLPGDGGGKLANINRWRRQLGQGPLAEGELASVASALNVPGAEAYLVDLRNPDTQKRMLAAAVVRGGRSWFYKLMGDADVVESEKSLFVRFVEEAKYAD